MKLSKIQENETHKHRTTSELCAFYFRMRFGSVDLLFELCHVCIKKYKNIYTYMYNRAWFEIRCHVSRCVKLLLFLGLNDII